MCVINFLISIFLFFIFFSLQALPENVLVEKAQFTEYHEIKTYPAKIMNYNKRVLISGQAGYVSKVFQACGSYVSKDTPLVQITPFDSNYQTYTLKAPVQGYYLENENLQLGQVATKEPIAQITDLKEAFIKFHIPQDEIFAFNENIDLSNFTFHVTFRSHNFKQDHSLPLELSASHSKAVEMNLTDIKIFPLKNFTLNPIKTRFHTYVAFAQVLFDHSYLTHHFVPCSYCVEVTMPALPKMFIPSDALKYENLNVPALLISFLVMNNLFQNKKNGRGQTSSI